MAQSFTCYGHGKQGDRVNKIRPKESPDEKCRVLINTGPVSVVETSLKELEDSYKNKTEWKVIEDGGVLSIPVEELRMENPPRPDQSGQVVFQEWSDGGGRKQIDSYPVGQTIENMKALIREKYDEEKEKARFEGKSECEAEEKASAVATKLQEFKALNTWEDINAEIKLKNAIERMMISLKIPTLLIRSINLKQISALNELGLPLPGDAEIDLIMAYPAGDFLHIVVFEVKRRKTYPWEARPRPPAKQAVDKAENQLTKDVKILTAILAGIPPDRVVLHTLACYPEASEAELQTIICSECLESSVVYEEDLNSSSLLQKKTQV